MWKGGGVVPLLWLEAMGIARGVMTTGYGDREALLGIIYCCEVVKDVFK